MIDDLTQSEQLAFADFVDAAEDELDDYDDSECVAEPAGHSGIGAVALFRQLTAAGLAPEAARAAAADTAAAIAMRMRQRQTGVARDLRARFGELAGQVAAGRSPATALADYREDIAGWRGDGRAHGRFADPVPVSFPDGTVVPDGAELVGMRETAARHAIVAPLVVSGIDSYDEARASGAPDEQLMAGVPDVPGVSDVVATYAYRRNALGMEPSEARAEVIADAVTAAALGQFLSLRAQGIPLGEAAAVAAAGDPVAVHAIAGFVQRCREGEAEDWAELSAVEAAQVAAEEGEDYRGLTPRSDELPGYGEFRAEAEDVLAWHTPELAPPTGEDRLAGEVVGRFERLTRCGMDHATAARLAAAETAERRALAREEQESAAIGAAQAIVVDAADDLLNHLESHLPHWPGDDEDGDDEHGGLGRAVAESGHTVDEAEDAVARCCEVSGDEPCGYRPAAGDEDCDRDCDDDWDER